MQVARPVLCLTQSLGEGPAFAFIFLAQPSAADIWMCGQWPGQLEEASVPREALEG